MNCAHPPKFGVLCDECGADITSEVFAQRETALMERLDAIWRTLSEAGISHGRTLEGLREGLTRHKEAP